MKKKIIAVLLTLCMVVGLLPLSALAASWTVTLNGQTITLTEDESGTITSEPDQSSYYTFAKVEGQDKFTYYTLDGVYGGELTGTPVQAETVETPVFNPAAGEVESGAEVTITCATEGASIYYTVDGSEPTAESTLYSAPIAVTEAMTIKAIAVKGDAVSEVASAAYTVAQTSTETGAEMETTTNAEEVTGADVPEVDGTAKKDTAAPTAQEIAAAIEAAKDGDESVEVTEITITAKSEAAPGSVVVSAEITLAEETVSALKEMEKTTVITNVGTVELPKEAMAKVSASTTLIVKQVAKTAVDAIKDAAAQAAPVEVSLEGVTVENLTDPITITVPADETVKAAATKLNPLYILHIHGSKIENMGKAVLDEFNNVVIKTLGLSTFIQTTKDGVTEITGEVLDPETMTATIDTAAAGLKGAVTVTELPDGKWVYFQMTTNAGTFGSPYEVKNNTAGPFNVKNNGTLQIWVFDESPVYDQNGVFTTPAEANNGDGQTIGSGLAE